MAVAFYFHWATHTSTKMIGLAGLSPIAAVPLVFLLVAAWRSGWPIMRLSAVVCATVYAASFLSPGSVLGCGPTPATDPNRQMVIYTHNVKVDGAPAADVANEILAFEPDIVVLQETSQRFMTSLANIDALAEYRFRAADTGQLSRLAIWSRWPLGDTTVSLLSSARRSRNVMRTTVETPAGPIDLWNVHLMAPLGESRVDAWQAELETLTAGPPSAPTVVAGDFNATPQHAQFRRVLASGWSDVHEAKGCGRDTTWPAGRFPVPTLLRLDHMLVTSHFEVRAASLGNNSESDHRPLIAVLELPSGPPD